MSYLITFFEKIQFFFGDEPSVCIAFARFDNAHVVLRVQPVVFQHKIRAVIALLIRLVGKGKAFRPLNSSRARPVSFSYSLITDIVNHPVRFQRLRLVHLFRRSHGNFGGLSICQAYPAIHKLPAVHRSNLNF